MINNDYFAGKMEIKLAFLAHNRVARFFFVQYIKTGENMPTFSIPRPFKMYLSKVGFLVLKYTIWKPWLTIQLSIVP
jgi:hypothetical protein